MILLVDQNPPFPKTQGHNRTDIIGRSNNLGTDKRFLYKIQRAGRRHIRRIVHLIDLAFGGMSDIHHIRNRGNHIHIEFPVQTFLNDLHMEHSQKSATETESQGCRRFRFESQRCIVQLQFLYRSPQIFVIFRINRINPGKYHGFHFFETIDGNITRFVDMSDRISDFYLGGSFDT